MQAHLRLRRERAAKLIREWDESIKKRELAEKRSLAPGWLDRDEKLLEPERKTGAHQTATTQEPLESNAKCLVPPDDGGASKEGEELDRAFGNFGLR